MSAADWSNLGRHVTGPARAPHPDLAAWLAESGGSPAPHLVVLDSQWGDRAGLGAPVWSQTGDRGRLGVTEATDGPGGSGGHLEGPAAASGQRGSPGGEEACRQPAYLFSRTPDSGLP